MSSRTRLVREPIIAPEGIIHPYRETITHDTPLSIESVHPWWSIFIWNEGPDPVDTFINGTELSFRLEDDESRKIDMGAPLLTDFLITVETGESATVRIDTVR